MIEQNRTFMFLRLRRGISRIIFVSHCPHTGFVRMGCNSDGSEGFVDSGGQSLSALLEQTEAEIEAWSKS
jgi:hypothetical protein